ncbi:hypothetical protein L6452_30760 [Arctium lappa]|uniref:Uncharacterized protein n=1 Tax=Arctium lappa TaxID=4217 RepID=A0ACB8ZI67_ARCLA|nr:hypothetical protein L6452_30760 [Arctium lappa]
MIMWTKKSSNLLKISHDHAKLEGVIAHSYDMGNLKIDSLPYCTPLSFHRCAPLPPSFSNPFLSLSPLLSLLVLSTPPYPYLQSSRADQKIFHNNKQNFPISTLIFNSIKI